MRPLVKICGLTRPQDAALAVELGADLVGMVFYAASPRAVDRGAAREVAAAVAGRVPLVGVFVNAAADEIEETAAAIGLDLVQLHGDEPDRQTQALAGRALRAFRGGAHEAAARMPNLPEAWGFLVDSDDRLRYGGTGRTWAWRPLPRPRAGQRLLVAGGIGADNARAALAQTGADGIDVSSRVESSPGVKEPELLRRLFEEIGHGAIQERT